MRIGDVVELAIWVTGDEPEWQVTDWKTKALLSAKINTERENEIKLGPWAISEKRPGENRVPPVPDWVQGSDVRLLVAEAPVVEIVKPMIVKQTGFIYDLTVADRKKLRRLTRAAHSKAHPGQVLNDKQCDAIIEFLGPDVAVQTLRDGK